MPWKESCIVDERLRFVARLIDGERMAAVCREFGISRKTGYKIWKRYQRVGLHGLSDRSRRPYRYWKPAATNTTLINQVTVKQRRVIFKAGPEFMWFPTRRSLIEVSCLASPKASWELVSNVHSTIKPTT